ncbi:Conserved TM helix [Lishizhenia tianjinensis]|uniref:Conserved TM helix n=1 Tax=Lishizhenia tianjinensis TaxID=477690 RepID=A0A1I6ZMN6_9FLAO|nr:mechanosensitive ion channel domain-containing protein [Lishizhenia tianjinensis]SFT63966.1 Conserved TM helix [Lishizhenia tianjinensis]
MTNVNRLKETFDILWQETLEILPTLLFGLLILLVGWLMAKLLAYVVLRVLNRTKNSKVASALNVDDLSDKLNFEFSLPVIVSKIVYWLVFLLAIVGAAESIGWTNVSQELTALIQYLPKIMSALLIFILGYTLAKFLKKSVKSITQSMGLGLGAFVSDILFYFLLVIIILTSLSQAGLDITLISSHIYIILGAFALILSLAIGLGSKNVVTDIIKTHYNRSNLELGDKVEINNITGTVVSISRTSVILETEKEKHIFPSDTFYSNYYKIIK